MKVFLTILGVAMLIASAIYFSRAPTVAPGVAERAVSVPVLPASGPVPPGERTEPLPATPPAPDTLADHSPSGDFDPMLVMALGDFSDEEIARYNDLHILPFNKAVDRVCEELPDPNILGQTRTVCRTVREQPEHPYAQLDTQALMELAVHDEVASLFLGRRARQEEQRLHWYLRAAALSGKSGPLMSLAETRYGSVHALKTIEGRFQAVAQLDNIAKRIALDTVAQKMGDPRAHPERWQQTLREVAADQADEYLARANTLTNEFLQSMARTQREITGSVQIQEIIDNA